MAKPFPFETNPDKYLRHLWNKATYLYLAEFFRTAQFDKNLLPIDGFSVNDYRGTRAGQYAASDSDEATANDGWMLPGSGGAGASSYASYFAVVDSTSGSDCKIGVTDGGWIGTGTPPSTPTNCGTAVINGVRVDVAVFTGAAITTEGVYWVWLHCWEDSADGADAEIIVGPVDDDTPPDNPNGGVAFSNRLIGRVSVVESEGTYLIDSITQDYLAGGECHEILYGDCEGDAEE